MVTRCLPFGSIINPMTKFRNRYDQAALLSLEAEASSARSGFACLFSTADEYERALIMQRREEGRYGRPDGPWPILMFIGCAMMLFGGVLLLK
jgi:hypothetical protein